MALLTPYLLMFSLALALGDDCPDPRFSFVGPQSIPADAPSKNLIGNVRDGCFGQLYKPNGAKVVLGTGARVCFANCLNKLVLSVSDTALQMGEGSSVLSTGFSEFQTNGLVMGSSSKIQLGQSGNWVTNGSVTLGNNVQVTVGTSSLLSIDPTSKLEMGDSSVLSIGERSELVLPANSYLKFIGSIPSAQVTIGDSATLTIGEGTTCIVYGPAEDIYQFTHIIWVIDGSHENVNCYETGLFDEESAKQAFIE